MELLGVRGGGKVFSSTVRVGTVIRRDVDRRRLPAPYELLDIRCESTATILNPASRPAYKF